jgi:Zn-dependent protease with chaperone function
VRISPDTSDPLQRRLLNVVEEIAIASGVPMPEVYLLEQESGINAFAAGMNPANAAIGVTRGALTNLNRAELQGVIGHEFSHVLNGDMRLNVRLIGLLFGIMAIGVIGRYVLWGGYLGGGRRRRDGNGNGNVVLAGMALLIVGAIGLFFGRLIQAAVARSRESLADA